MKNGQTKLNEGALQSVSGAESRETTATGTGRILVAFTLLYILCMGLRVAFFLLAGKSMICAADAQEQHINALIVYGKWMRGIVYTLVHEHRIALQNYSFGIGYGADFYTSMQYYAVGDPLNLPAAILPSSMIYYYFQFLILLRPYLAGLSFIALCLTRRKAGAFADGSGCGKTEQRKGNAGFTAPCTCGIVAGALIYAFSGTVLFIGMWNPFFVTPLITLPLLIRGVDILLGERRSAPFVLAVFLAGIANFYFFYIQVILLFGYFALRAIFDRDHAGSLTAASHDTPEALQRRRILPLFLRFVGSGALGVCMSGILLVPMLPALIGNPRVGGHSLPLVYDADYYLQLMKNLFFYIYHPLHDTELALTPMVLPAILLALFAAGRYGFTRERATLLVLIAMLLIPAAGYVMSGFAYAINRWCFAFALCAAWLTAVTWEKWLTRRVWQRVGVCVTAGFVLANIVLADASAAGNLPNGFVERMSGQAFLDQMTATEDRALTETVLPDADRFARYSGRNLVWNASLLHGISSTQFYWSLANGVLAELFAETAVNEMADFSYYGLEDRAMLMKAAGVTHYTLRYDTPEEALYVPAGYERAAEYYNFAIFEDPLPVGLGTVYDRVLARSEYLSRRPWEREEMMLHAAVLDDADVSRAEAAGIRRASLAMDTEMLQAGSVDGLPLTARTVPVRVLPGDGVTWEAEGNGGRFVVTGEEGGCAMLLFDTAQDVTAGDIEATNETLTEAAGDAGTVSAETALYLGGLSIDGPRDIVNMQVDAISDDEAFTDGAPIRRTISYKTPESEFYSGWHDYLVNFGSRASCEGVEITFPEAGVYAAEEITGLIRPVNSAIAGRAEEMTARAVTQTDLHRNPVSFMTDRVTCTASCPDGENGLLVLTIPWQHGWRAYVDGERVPLVRTNTAFTGLFLDAGVHEITLIYRTPGLLAGLLFTLAGFSGFIVLALFERRQGRKK